MGRGEGALPPVCARGQGVLLQCRVCPTGLPGGDDQQATAGGVPSAERLPHPQDERDLVLYLQAGSGTAGMPLHLRAEGQAHAVPG